jgi:peptidyl-prolyl cis-trans isomerase C
MRRTLSRLLPRPLPLLLLLTAACDRSPRVDFRHRSGVEGGTPVARFGGDAITAEELQRRFLEMSPQARARYQTVEQKREYVEGLARFELLVQEAVRRGMHNDPEVVENAKKVMVQRLLTRELDENPPPLPEEELRAAYQKRLSDYVKPEMVRLAHVFVAAPAAGGDPAARAEKRKKAEALLEKAKGLDTRSPGAFGTLARESSEEPRTRPLDGDMRYLAVDELSAQYGAEVAAAAAELKSVGEVLPRLVETPGGFHVLKLLGRQQALSLSFEEVRGQLESRLRYEQRTQRFERFLADLKQRSGYSVDDQALARVAVDLQAPAQPPSGPSPGFLQPPPGAPASPAVAPPSSAR